MPNISQTSGSTRGDPISPRFGIKSPMVPSASCIGRARQPLTWRASQPPGPGFSSGPMCWNSYRPASLAKPGSPPTAAIGWGSPRASATGRSKYNYCDDPEWVVEFVWCSDGGDGEVKGCYYTVGEGSPEKHMIFLYTMSFDRVPSANDTARRGFNSSFGKECSTRMVAILAIDNWCSQNREKRKRVNFAMSRNVSPLASRYLSTSRTVLFQDNTVLCTRSAVCNTMSLVLGRSAADRLWMAEAARVAAFERRMNYSPSVHHSTHVQRVIRADHHGTVSLDRVAPPPGAIIEGRSSSKLPLWRSSDVSWLVCMPRGQAGVYVLRITDVNHLRHAVCVDARTEPGLIYDCAERFAMQPKDTSLRLCCPAADPTKFQYFKDMRFSR